MPMAGHRPARHLAGLFALGGVLAAAGSLAGCAAMGYAPEAKTDSPAEHRVLGWAAMSRSPVADTPAAAASRPEDRQGILNAAYRRIYENRYQEAVDLLAPLAGQTSRADPQGPEILFWLGFARQELGDRAGARSAYDRLVNTWPQSPYADRARKLAAELR